MHKDCLRPETASTACPLFVVSPHLDDAAFGCAALLAACPGACVCTVFAGLPAHPQSTQWDRAAGFDDSTQAMRERRREDDRALAHFGARAIRLPFLDGQYGALPDVGRLADEIAKAYECACTVDASLVVPLGVRHPDHMRVGEAWARLLRTGRVGSCIVYEDAIHRAARGAVEKRLAELEAGGLHAAPLDESWRPERLGARALSIRRRAILEYASQLRAFDSAFPADLARPERYWCVRRA
ncbi:PIG-L family deacetylase [Paraburkholderia lycopersici]|uniref:GlcNAc-PI de-N-acetylase n=1 Tax=Paraburkholderia lycopersici TaxID=416944 RepID=A0A1G7D166_9BURK|nr:PIG-L family deacetylase [Paraburkholderia lycopersici]SDE44760.1 GlcNAc-PI de-N-acetylase [Paraburkholderia lycopersici]